MASLSAGVQGLTKLNGQVVLSDVTDQALQYG